MKTIAYVITDKLGLHARPAGMLAREATKFQSAIKISTSEKTVDAKRIMGVMGLCMKCGDTITMTFEGTDEEKAEEGIKQFLTETL